MTRIFSTLAVLSTGVLITALWLGFAIQNASDRTLVAQQQVTIHFLTAVGAIVFAVLNLIATVGLVSGMRFGWILAMSLAGWNVGYFLVLWWIGDPAWLGMALAVVIVFLLSSREMRRAYRAEAS